MAIEQSQVDLPTHPVFIQVMPALRQLLVQLTGLTERVGSWCVLIQDSFQAERPGAEDGAVLFSTIMAILLPLDNMMERSDGGADLDHTRSRPASPVTQIELNEAWGLPQAYHRISLPLFRPRYRCYAGRSQPCHQATQAVPSSPHALNSTPLHGGGTFAPARLCLPGHLQISDIQPVFWSLR